MTSPDTRPFHDIATAPRDGREIEGHWADCGLDDPHEFDERVRYSCESEEWQTAKDYRPGWTWVRPPTHWREILLVAEAGEKRPTVVCLCGSSRHPELHMRAMMNETLAGRIVIPMGLYGHADFPTGAKAATADGDETTEVKQMLDRLHFAKIDASDEILVIRIAGYIGSSTKREITYAEKTGKSVRYLDIEPAATPAPGASGTPRINKTKLTSLDPRWVGIGDTGALIIGVTFKSPITGNRLGVLFANPLDREKWMETIGNPMDVPGFLPDSKRWQRAGETFETLTLLPSLDFSAHNEWHGFITNGEIL